MNRLKILWLSHVVPYPPRGFGVLQRSHHLVREVARYHDVSLVSFIQKGLLAATFPSVEAGLVEARRVLSEFCVSVDFVPIPSEERAYGKFWLALSSLLQRDPSSINWLKSPAMSTAIRQQFQPDHFDLVHFDTISLAPYLKDVTDSATVLDHHSIESHMMLRRAAKEPSPIKKVYFMQEGIRLQSYEKRVCPKFDANITCSTLDSDRLRELIPSGSLIDEIPNGVDINYFQPSERPVVSQSMIFVGSLNWYPNRDAMIYFAEQIWPAIKQRIPQAQMDVVGAHPPKELLALAAQDGNFRVHGFVDDVRPYIERAAVYVCPIRDGGGTRLKILDALAMGKAIVAHPIACEGIEVTDNKDILLATDPDGYVAHLERLFRDEPYRNLIGSAGRNLIVSKYSYTAIGKKLADLYNRVVTTRNQSQLQDYGNTNSLRSPRQKPY